MAALQDQPKIVRTDVNFDSRQLPLDQSARVRRPRMIQTLTDPTPISTDRRGSLGPTGSRISAIIHDRTQPSAQAERRRSNSTIEAYSRASSPGLCASSSATSPSIYAPENFRSSFKPRHKPQRSVIQRLRESVRVSSHPDLAQQTRSIEPSEFLNLPEQPEKLFVDSIGVVCPGVSDRPQCAHPLTHFVSAFRICQPLEYTTALAEHGLTYTDYCRLLAALKIFLVGNEPITSRTCRQDTITTEEDGQGYATVKHRPHKQGKQETTIQLQHAQATANALNILLHDISSNLQARGVEITICIGSFSLFSPNHISETHVQILHTPSGMLSRSDSVVPDARLGQRLSFIKTGSLVDSEPKTVSKPRPPFEERWSHDSPTEPNGPRNVHRTSQHRDRSRPWSLWPNAIPSTKRQTMSRNADRYGMDPFFRAWMRATINSQTRSSSYAQYMIEQEDEAYVVNRRLGYSDPPTRRVLVRMALEKRKNAWTENRSGAINRARYEQNRRLEYRKTIERGSRLRILSFGFRHPIYPPHNPEMKELGLSKKAYDEIKDKITGIQSTIQLGTKSPVSYSLSFWNKLRHRSTEDALLKVGEYLRELNASQRLLVWTLERIPDVYERGFARDSTEWEISAWNGEDALELIIQLERWGLIERRLSIDEDT